MTRFFFAIFLTFFILSPEGFAGNGPAKKFSVDGPYIFQKKNKFILKSIRQQENAYSIEIKEFFKTDGLPAIDVFSDAFPNRSFRVQIKADYNIPSSSYPSYSKLYAISDLEGNFKVLVNSLQGNGVIDENWNWVFGDGHLVVLGDLFDRGHDVTACLWLLYKLDQEATAAGGQLHFILGNHEEMNLRGDIRYVKDKYKFVAQKLKVSVKSLFAANTVLGEWLRSKNAVEKIGKTLFTHGGISPRLAEQKMDLDKINDFIRRHLGEEKWRIEQNGGLPHLLMDKKGPMWYRGYFREPLTQNQIERICALFGVNHIVVGHTVVNEISTLYNGRIFAIDVNHKEKENKDKPHALYVKDGVFAAVNIPGESFEIPYLYTLNEIDIYDAIENNHLKKIQVYLESHPPVSAPEAANKLPLIHYAIEKSKLEAVVLLLESGLDPNEFYKDKNALMFAIKHNAYDIAELLLKYGMNLEDQNSRNMTAIYYAARYCKPDMAQLLISNGAKADALDKKSRTPLDYALEHRNKLTAEYLKSINK